MVKFFQPSTVDVHDYDSFYASLETIDAAFESDAYVAAAATELAKLANNRGLIYSRFVESGGWSGVRQAFQSTQSIVLENRPTKHGRIALRCNFWFPIANSQFYRLERDLYAYELAHNHNFRFLTVGYFGNGYLTDLGVVDPDRLSTHPDQHVQILQRQSARLERGKVLYFEPFSDVHVQHPSDDISISLNLILGSSEWEREQYEFDLDRSVKLRDIPQGSVDRAISAIDFASFFATPETEELLQDLAKTAPFENIRNAAQVALTRTRARLAAEGAGVAVSADNEHFAG